LIYNHLVMRIPAAFASFLALCITAVAQSPGTEFLRRVEFEERPALLLSNDKIELTMLTTGGSFVNLVLKDDPERLSPLWNPVRMARESGEHRRGRGPGAGFGHFVCVDGFGPVSKEEQAAGMPGHGEAHTQPWEVLSSVKKDGVLSVAFSANLPLVQETFRRTVRLVDGEPVVYVESDLENLLAFDRPVCWAEHATIGSPFLEPGKTVVDMSARQAKTRTHADEQGPQPHRLVNFKDFTWPMAPGLDGQLIDLRAAPLNPNSLDHTTCLMDPGRTLVFVTALHSEKRLLLGYLFKREEYPWVQNWENYPSSMRMARGMEISTQPFDVPRREVIDMRSMFGAPVYRWLPAKSKIGSRFLFFYTKTPEGFQKVDDVILQNGKLDIEDRAAGKRITLPASVGL
jgi:hypothetical protein